MGIDNSPNNSLHMGIDNSPNNSLLCAFGAERRASAAPESRSGA
jgi:hypothetical protein